MKIAKKTQLETEISTASMPDIVFLLLFFFMVTATIRSQEELVEARIPDAHAVNPIRKEFLVKELMIGLPKNNLLGNEPRISDGQKLIAIENIGPWVISQKNTLNEAYRDQMIVMIKADKEVNMGIIGDVQNELRKHNARKILYRTLEN